MFVKTRALGRTDEQGTPGAEYRSGRGRETSPSNWARGSGRPTSRDLSWAKWNREHDRNLRWWFAAGGRKLGDQK